MDGGGEMGAVDGPYFDVLGFFVVRCQRALPFCCAPTAFAAKGTAFLLLCSCLFLPPQGSASKAVPSKTLPFCL